jgi:hypothetical protein
LPVQLAGRSPMWWLECDVSTLLCLHWVKKNVSFRCHCGQCRVLLYYMRPIGPHMIQSFTDGSCVVFKIDMAHWAASYWTVYCSLNICGPLGRICSTLYTMHGQSIYDIYPSRTIGMQMV